MLAEIITIGDELLIGQTVDTNSAWMGAALNKMGITVRQVTSIPDERARILTALKESEARADLILITGGLGPTTDDITKPTLCEYFGTQLVMHPDILQDITDWFAAAGRPMLEVNRQQAALPESATILRNRRGTASGMWFEKQDTVFVSMPGVPYEMRGLMTEVLERVEERFDRPAIVHRTVMTIGQGESFIAKQVAAWADALPAKGLKLAYLPSAGQVRIRISGTGPDLAALTQLVEAERDALVAQISDIVFGFDDESMEAIVGRLLVSAGRTVATAESCTGGYIAHLLTSKPGSSAYFLGSIVSYANTVKEQQLGVDAQALMDHGAVSQPVVEQMARGAQQRLGTDYAVATSGVAGPDGGSDEKPVGTVWIAVAYPGGVESARFQFGKRREHNIRRAAMTALNLLRKKIEG